MKKNVPGFRHAGVLSSSIGFTLLEALVLMGLSSAMMMAALDYIQTGQKSVINLGATSGYYNLIASVQLATNNDESCTRMFADITNTFVAGTPPSYVATHPGVYNPAAGGIAGGLPGNPLGLITTLWDMATPAVPIVTTANRGHYSNFQINSIGIQDLGQPVTNTVLIDQVAHPTYHAQLMLDAQKVTIGQPGQNFGGNVLHMPLPVNIVVITGSSATPNDGSFTMCYGENDARAQACTNMGGTPTPGVTPYCVLHQVSFWPDPPNTSSGRNGPPPQNPAAPNTPLSGEKLQLYSYPQSNTMPMDYGFPSQDDFAVGADDGVTSGVMSLWFTTSSATGTGQSGRYRWHYNRRPDPGPGPPDMGGAFDLMTLDNTGLLTLFGNNDLNAVSSAYSAAEGKFDATSDVTGPAVVNNSLIGGPYAAGKYWHNPTLVFGGRAGNLSGLSLGYDDVGHPMSYEMIMAHAADGPGTGPGDGTPLSLDFITAGSGGRLQILNALGSIMLGSKSSGTGPQIDASGAIPGPHGRISFGGTNSGTPGANNSAWIGENVWGGGNPDVGLEFDGLNANVSTPFLQIGIATRITTLWSALLVNTNAIVSDVYTSLAYFKGVDVVASPPNPLNLRAIDAFPGGSPAFVTTYDVGSEHPNPVVLNGPPNVNAPSLVGVDAIFSDNGFQSGIGGGAPPGAPCLF